MSGLLLGFLMFAIGGGRVCQAGDASVASRPSVRMGDPWGMIYGGSGWWEHENPHRTNIQERAAAGARDMARFGVQASRVGVCWHDVERDRGTYDWTMPDATIPAVADAGIHVVLCVATTPRWAWRHPEVEWTLNQRNQANLAGCLPFKPAYWPDYERYLSAVVKRYGKHVRHYEIWNEPDGMAGFRFIENPAGALAGFQHGGDPVWYAELVKRSYRIIKSLDPQARVGIGSYEVKKAMPPFVLDSSLASLLADGKVAEALRKAFASQPDAPLSPMAVIRGEPGGKWVINDDQNGRRYRVASEKEGLKVSDEKTWFIERLYEEGVRDSYDAMSIHAYGNPFRRDWLGTVRRLMVERGDGGKPLWLNEYSLHGKGVGLAFNTIRQLRLLRETPWISMAQPLVFACHLDPEISPGGRSLKAHKRMAEEFVPRGEFVADFEGPVLRLLDNWEWNATGAGKNGVDGPELSQEYPHGGERCLTAGTPDSMIRVWFSPYVKGKDRYFSGYLLVEPKDKEARLSLSAGVESGDILQEIRLVRPLGSEVPAGRWFRWDCAIDERCPEWKDLAVVTTYIEIESDRPGLTVSVDDVRVGEAAKDEGGKRKDE